MLKTYVLICSLALFLLSCAHVPVATFKQSNQYFIEKTANRLQITPLLRNTISSDSRIAVLSMEIPQSLDAPVFSTVEDQIISQVAKNGYTILERDQDVIKRLIEEKSGDHYSVLQTCRLQDNTTPDSLFKYETHLEPADYLLVYRILECGLIYRDGKKFTTREGMVRLHLRLINTSNGKIIVAGNLSANHEDKIDSRLVRKVEDFHYSFYQSEMPVQKKKQFFLF